ncbi:uncharacterized protein LOC130555030 isoform X2 [Triplophysa rosa]|uniref:uncharacterized protein LOC130555030 isoform X2 n=1 Tax=Triplophysa rosa TaxID=992332 RepID=UPI002545CCA5|nr:uncharacterized protein LOC130555030 isoform X2 [Triplophysa rosa]
MAKVRAKCSVDGCTDQHRSLFRVTASEKSREQWILFIFNGNPPERVSKNLFVCANHFKPECFVNLGQYKAGFATKLFLKEGATPTEGAKASDEENTSTSAQFAVKACQTDKPTRSYGTQLSMKTLAPPFRSTGVQTDTEYCTDVSVGTSAVRSSRLFTSTPHKRPRLELEEEEEEDEFDPVEGDLSVIVEEPRDVTHDPLQSVTLTESTDVTMESSIPIHKTSTCIVYENCLMELFEVCPKCERHSSPKTRTMGTFLRVEQNCPHCEFSRTWNSQPIIGSTPAGNIQLTAAVYISGASFFKLEKIFHAIKLKLFKYTTFRRLARRFIEPAIVHRWKTTQDATLQQLGQQQNVILGGDMRADSPGHSARYGSYTMMDLRNNMIVDLQLVQSNEVGGSYHMEMEGLKRSLVLLEERGVTLDSIVTDRHPQIQKFLKESRIKHYFDVWHIEKGLSKKLVLMSKNKDCDVLKKWLHSVKNHMYWTAASSTSGPERVAKWTSILNHIRDVHIHKNPAFPQCLHAPLTSGRKKKWLKAGTKAFCKLEKALTNKRLLKDVEKMSPQHQTSSLEAFHSVILRFAPKNVVFPFLGTLCRLYLAVMHFNENAGRPQAKSSTGELLYEVNFPKSKKGECTVKPVKVDPTYGL